MIRAGLTFLAIVASSVWSGAQTVSISGATVGNVAVGQFDVFWGVDGASEPGLDIFSDAGGLTSLNGQLGVEFSPLEMNPASVGQTADQRQARRDLQGLMSSKGIVFCRVTGATPGTTYYVRPRSYGPAGIPNESAQAPLLPVTMAQTSSLVMESRQLRVGFGGCFAGSQGLVMKLSLVGAPYPLLAVVGDHELTEQALFDLSRLLNGAGTSNAELTGTPQFTLELIGPQAPEGTLDTDVAFASTHVVAELTDSVFLVSFPGLAYFSLEAVKSPLQGVPFVFNVTARASDGSVLTTYNSNVDLAPGDSAELFEGEGATAPFVAGVLENYQVIPAVSGNLTLTVSRACGIETGSETFTVSEMSDQNYRDHYFGVDANNPLIAGFGADADGDRLWNGLERYFGLNPTLYDVSPLEDVEQDNDDDEFIFCYWRARVHGGLIAQSRWTDDFTMWYTSGVTEEVVETRGGYEKIKVTIDSSGMDRMFADVQVSQPGL
jgi:hypothetical protein